MSSALPEVGPPGRRCGWLPRQSSWLGEGANGGQDLGAAIGGPGHPVTFAVAAGLRGWMSQGVGLAVVIFSIDASNEGSVMSNNLPFIPVVQLLWMGLACLVLVTITVVLVLRWRAEFRRFDSALWILDHQHDEASPAMLAGLAHQARLAGRSRELQDKIGDIRRAYGVDGLRVAHVLWLKAFIHGRYPNDALPPAFDGTPAGSDIAEFCRNDTAIKMPA